MSKDKDVMAPPKSRAAILGALQSEAKALETTPPADRAPLREHVEPSMSPSVEDAVDIDEQPQVEESRAVAQPRRGRDLSPNQLRELQREWKPKKESRDQAVARYPISLLEDLDTIASITKMTKQQIMEDALRKEVAFWKKRIGLD